MKRLGTILATALILIGGIVYAVSTTQLNGFKVINVGGKNKTVKCMIDGAYQPAKVGQVYPFGTIVKTSRASTADLELSEGNTVRLMPRSTLAIKTDTKNPKLKILKLDKGSVSVTLDKFPKGHKLQVETPTAVCGALGTRFVISFEDDKDETVAATKAGSRENRISCEKGEIYAASRFTIDSITNVGKTLDAPSIKAGTELVAKVHEGLENSYTDISVTRGSLNIDYGIKKGGKFKVEAGDEEPGRFTMALGKSDSDVDAAVIEVKSGKVHYGRDAGFSLSSDKLDTIAPSDGPVLVSNASVMSAGKAKVVGEYLAAAKVEAEMHSKLVAAGKDPAKSDELKAVAKTATDLRKQLVSKRVKRLLQQIRRASQRRNRMRRP